MLKEVFMSNKNYNISKYLQFTTGLGLLTNTIKILLVNGYTFSQAHQYVSDIDHETTGTGYVRKTLAGKTVTIDTTNNRATFNAADVTWDLATFSADGAIIYIDNGSDATSTLITYLDFGIIKSSNNTPFVIEWSNAEGILNNR
jgi:hypothetical protein